MDKQIRIVKKSSLIVFSYLIKATTLTNHYSRLIASNSRQIFNSGNQSIISCVCPNFVFQPSLLMLSLSTMMLLTVFSPLFTTFQTLRIWARCKLGRANWRRVLNQHTTILYRCGHLDPMFMIRTLPLLLFRTFNLMIYFKLPLLYPVLYPCRSSLIGNNANWH